MTEQHQIHHPKPHFSRERTHLSLTNPLLCPTAWLLQLNPDLPHSILFPLQAPSQSLCNWNLQKIFTHSHTHIHSRRKLWKHFPELGQASLFYSIWKGEEKKQVLRILGSFFSARKAALIKKLPGVPNTICSSLFSCNDLIAWVTDALSRTFPGASKYHHCTIKQAYI